MSIKCYFSNRIYKNKLDNILLLNIINTHDIYNKALHSVFNFQILESRAISNGKTKDKTNYHKWLKDKYGFDDYYANSILQQSKAMLLSQEELNKLYIEQTELDIKEIKKKITKTKSRKTVLQKIKDSLKKKGTPKFNKTGEFILNGDNSVSRFTNYLNKKKRREVKYKDIYTFEVEYLNKELKRHKQRIGALTFKLNKYTPKLKKLKDKNYIKSIVFGSKNLIRKYHNEKLPNKKKKLLNKFKHRRKKSFGVSGRKDAKFGNFIFNYDYENKTLNMLTPDKKTITLKNVHFPYGGESIDNYYKIQTSLTTEEKKSKTIFVPGVGKVPTSKAKPISFTVEDHKTYYIVKCQLDVENENIITLKNSYGIVGVDCNLDHYALCNVSDDGNLLNSKVINFDLFKKSSGQITKIIENRAKEVVDYAYNLSKPIGLEKLNTTLSKSGKKYNNKKNNLSLSMFAYKKLTSAIKSRAEKMGVEVVEINPAYTSISAKFKYMKKYKTSIHQVAGLTIGRKALGYKENIPKYYKKLIPKVNEKKNNYLKWNEINKFYKKIEDKAI